MQLRPSRKKIGVRLLICAAIAGLGAWFTIATDSLPALLGLVMAIFFGLSLLYLLAEFIHPIEWWELTPEGITSHALGKPLTTRWDDLEEIALWRYGRLGQKRVYLKTRSGRLREAREPMFARKVRTQSGYHAIITASQFSITADEFFHLLQRYWKDEGARARLASGESSARLAPSPQE
ncbi:MAG TPA: STM3941 family protein [Ktedonobacterales bacterium]|jgi:hypothetical protein